jgi:oligogalacturonide lyase
MASKRQKVKLPHPGVYAMKFNRLAAGFSALACVLAGAGLGVPAQAKPQAEWVDATTGHRVVRISDLPGTASLYFTQSAFTPNGDKLVMKTPQGIAVVTMADWSIKLLVPGPSLNLLFTGHKSRNVYYATRGRDDGGLGFEVWAADIDTGKTRKLVDVANGSIGSINADETLLLGQYTLPPATVNPDGTLKPAGQAAGNATPGGYTYAETRPNGVPYTYADAKTRALHRRLKSGLPMEIFTVNLKTGERKVLVASNDWLNHVQFSPNDPGLVMYCHEGPWHEVDRIWTIRTDGTNNKLVHARTMNNEIAGHEFFSPDGQTIWYDLQTPRGQVFWLAGYNVATGKRTWYKVERDQWSVHYNQSNDLKLFSGDGGDSEMVAHAADGKYLYLFHPKGIPDDAEIPTANAENLIVPGTLDAEKLVDMRHHNYKTEPNMTFTPDGKWIIFRGHFDEGSVPGQTKSGTHVYAVEVAKAR